MKHNRAADAVVAKLKELNDAGVPTFGIYLDDEGWHAAGPLDYTRADMAAIFRGAAKSCEEQARPEGVTLN